MKNQPTIWMIVSIMITGLFLTGCNLPITSNPSNQPGMIYTQAAETIIAQLTQSVIETYVAEKTQEAQQGGTPVGSIPTQEPPTQVPTLLPPTSTNTPLPPTATYKPAPCDWALYVADITIPDGEIIAAGQSFNKVWRLKNIGTCTWTTDYDLVFAHGDRMEGNKVIPLTANVPPGSTVDVSAYLRAPEEKGYYQGYWMLRDESGNVFGIGGDYMTAFWVEIQVKYPLTTFDTPFYFAENYCRAQWSNDTHLLPCPGSSSSLGGYVILVKNPTLEKGGTDNEPALWVHPEFIKNGSIIGEYPPILIKDGDSFRTVVGCMKDATNCDVTFTLSYSANGGPITNLGSWSEVYDKAVTPVFIDLSFLKDQEVIFYFTVDANGSYKGDEAFWLAPQILNK